MSETETRSPAAPPDDVPAASPDQVEPSGFRRLAKHLRLAQFSALYLWLGFMVVFGILKPDAYLSDVTFKIVFSEGAAVCVLALAFLVPLAAGVFDISVGALLSLALAIVVYLQINTGLPPVAGSVIAIAACALVGLISGFIVVRLHVNSFMATFGMSQVLFAIVLLISQNRQLVGEFPASWSDLGLSDVFGIPVVFIYMLVIAVVIWYVFEHTPLGRSLFAIGGNADASRLAGIRTERLVWGSLVASAVLAALAGVIYSMRTGVYSTSIGPGLLFPSLTAVFLGASQLQQRPNVWGTLIAYFALAFGVQGIQLVAPSASVWSRPLFEGLALIIAIAVASRPAIARLRGRQIGVDLNSASH